MLQYFMFNREMVIYIYVCVCYKAGKVGNFFALVAMKWRYFHP